MKKSWKTVVQDGDSDVALYVQTTDSAVELDKKAEESGGSFIALQRFVAPREVPTKEQDHADLAAGALSHFRGSRHYSQRDLSIEEVAAIPAGLEGIAIGGTKEGSVVQFAVTVYVQKDPNQ